MSKPWLTPEPIRQRLAARGWSARRRKKVEHWFCFKKEGNWARVSVTYYSDGDLFFEAQWFKAGKVLVDQFLTIFGKKVA